jgi:hypothetical protein
VGLGSFGGGVPLAGQNNGQMPLVMPMPMTMQPPMHAPMVKGMGMMPGAQGGMGGWSMPMMQNTDTQQLQLQQQQQQQQQHMLMQRGGA